MLTHPRGGAALPAIGEAYMGGYLAGVIDTTRGNIIPEDVSQTGLRYALIVSPKSLETTATFAESNPTDIEGTSRTRWDGLTSTVGLVASAATCPAGEYCYGLAHPADAASPWYLPAMDELELIYRNLKATTTSNHASSPDSGTFPPRDTDGYNPSSDPAGAAYTSTDPGQTTVPAFRSGGGQEVALDGFYWTSTYEGAVWGVVNIKGQRMTNGQQYGRKYSDTGQPVRPVRRLVL